VGTPYLGEIKIVSFVFAPRGWAQCNGQLLPINQNQGLFSLLGTTYGGDGRVNFGLPDFRGRIPLHWGGGFTIGERGGEGGHTLTLAELPIHTHLASAKSGAGTLPAPSGNVWAAESKSHYSVTANSSMRQETVSSVGGSQAHLNLSPFLTLNFIIAISGVFPSPT